MDDTATTSETEPPRLSHAQIRTIMLSVTLALLLGSLGQTIVATALPAMPASGCGA